MNISIQQRADVTLSEAMKHAIKAVRTANSLSEDDYLKDGAIMYDWDAGHYNGTETRRNATERDIKALSLIAFLQSHKPVTHSFSVPVTLSGSLYDNLRASPTKHTYERVLDEVYEHSVKDNYNLDKPEFLDLCAKPTA